MILMRILPGVLKELSKHVPTVLFQTVEWGELASELPKISRRIIQKDHFQELFSHQKDLLASFNIMLSDKASSSNSIFSDKWSGEKILTLYYAQLFSSKGLYLDLRSNHFKSAQPEFIFNPSGFWTHFDEDFRLGLLKVYEGFYLENEAIYYQGLEDIGLLQKNWPEVDRAELAEIFSAQFGDARTTEISFNLEHFQASIIKLSHFLLKKKVKISKDFLYLGIYLVTMYSSLEETKSKLPVKEIYLEVRKKFSS
jgi:hypothetical protein